MQTSHSERALITFLAKEFMQHQSFFIPRWLLPVADTMYLYLELLYSSLSICELRNAIWLTSYSRKFEVPLTSCLDFVVISSNF